MQKNLPNGLKDDQRILEFGFIRWSFYNPLALIYLITLKKSGNFLTFAAQWLIPAAILQKWRQRQRRRDANSLTRENKWRMQSP